MMTMTRQFVGLDAEERLNMEEFYSLLKPGKTKLVALPHVSNALGCVNPVREIVTAAHEAGARVLLDACQSAPHMKVRNGCDPPRRGARQLAGKLLCPSWVLRRGLGSRSSVVTGVLCPPLLLCTPRS